jgi:hypothetical protein
VKRARRPAASPRPPPRGVLAGARARAADAAPARADRRPSHAHPSHARTARWLWPLLGGLLAAPLGAGCGAAAACPAGVPVTDAAGAPVRCTRAEECPRASAGVRVCTSEPALEAPCVRCVETRCETVVEACR